MTSRAATLLALLAVLLSPTSALTEPPQREVRLENESVRITIVGFQPGAGTGRHMGIEPELGIPLEGELVLETPEGRKTLRPGSVYWVPGLTPHDVRNGSTGPAKMWDVLLKRCQ